MAGRTRRAGRGPAGRWKRARAWCLLALAACSVAWSVPCRAHDFWMTPAAYVLAQPGPQRLALWVGEYFEGERAGFSREHAAAFKLWSKDGRRDLLEFVPARDAAAAFSLTLPAAGTYVLSYDSHPSTITLPAEKFNAYLHDEGLEHVLRMRERQGTLQEPGRERFRRCVKTVMQVGPARDAAAAREVGQRLELLPTTDPAAQGAGQPLSFSLRFDGAPLAGALVKAWHKQDGQTVQVRVRSDAQGRFTLSLPYAGPWLLSVVHMVPAAAGEEVDWDSFWATMTFQLR